MNPQPGPANLRDQQQPDFRLVQDIRDQLQAILEVQRKIEEAREDLLLKRENVRVSSKKVYQQRVETGDAEAELMNELRRFVSLNQDTLPPAVMSAFDKVEAKRDALGVLEDDYLKIERALTGYEWTFMEDETEFYQLDLQELKSTIESLVEKQQKIAHPSKVQKSSDFMPSPLPLHPPPPPPPPPLPPHLFLNPPSLGHFNWTTPTVFRPTVAPLPHHSQQTEGEWTRHSINTATSNLTTLKKEFETMRKTQVERLDAGLALELFEHDCSLTDSQRAITKPDRFTFPAKYFDILDRLAECEVEIQNLKTKEMQEEITVTAIERRNSAPAQPPLYTPAPSEMARALSDSAVPSLSEDPTSKHRIREWLLTDLKQSPVQRTLYLNTLEGFGVLGSQDDDWIERASHYWSLDSSTELLDAELNPSIVTDDTSDQPHVEEEFSTFHDRYKPSSSISDEVAHHDQSHLVYPPLRIFEKHVIAGSVDTKIDAATVVPVIPSAVSMQLSVATSRPRAASCPTIQVSEHRHSVEDRGVSQPPIDTKNEVTVYRSPGTREITRSVHNHVPGSLTFDVLPEISTHSGTDLSSDAPHLSPVNPFLSPPNHNTLHELVDPASNGPLSYTEIRIYLTPPTRPTSPRPLSEHEGRRVEQNRIGQLFSNLRQRRRTKSTPAVFIAQEQEDTPKRKRTELPLGVVFHRS